MKLIWLKSAKLKWTKTQLLPQLSRYKTITKLYLSRKNQHHPQSLYFSYKLTHQTMNTQHQNREDQFLKMLIQIQTSHLIFTMTGLMSNLMNIQDQNIH